MKKYLILLKNKRKGELDKDLLRQHVLHLRNLSFQNCLVLCGPFADNNDAMKIILAKDMDEARNIAQQDPFTIAAYYRETEIHELIEATPENNFLLGETLTNLTKQA